MQELRDRIRQLLDDTHVAQIDIVREINDAGMYRATTAELCKAIKGELTTPKGNRLLADAYSILQRERIKQLRKELRKK